MNIYVGNLPYSITEANLRDIFGEYGEVVSAKLITDKFSGQSKGFGFVEMANSEDGKKVIEELDGGMLEGRNIKVNEARPPQKRSFGDRPSGGGRSSYGGGGGGGRSKRY